MKFLEENISKIFFDICLWNIYIYTHTHIYIYLAISHGAREIKAKINKWDLIF